MLAIQRIFIQISFCTVCNRIINNYYSGNARLKLPDKEMLLSFPSSGKFGNRIHLCCNTGASMFNTYTCLKLAT